MGIYRWPDGSQEEGNWIRGKEDGEHVFTPINDEEPYRNVYENGKKVGMFNSEGTYIDKK